MTDMDLAIVVTRAEPGATETGHWLEEAGYQPILSPCLVLARDPAIGLPEPSDHEGIVFTSANGVRFYRECSTHRSQTAWCVGPATARAAHAAGFEDIQESRGDALALADFIAKRRSPSALPLLHIANSAAKGSFRARLQTLGHEVDFRPLYTANPAAHLSERANTALTGSEKTVILLHSEKGAAAFVHLAAILNLVNTSAVAISERAARPLHRLALVKCMIAPEPNEKGMQIALRKAADSL